MKELTNDDRSGRAADLLLIYSQRHDKGEDEETTFTDLLADLMHYADTYAIEWDGAVSRARMHYVAEVCEQEAQRVYEEACREEEQGHTSIAAKLYERYEDLMRHV